MPKQYQGRFYAAPFVRHRCAYSVLLTHDGLCKSTSKTGCRGCHCDIEQHMSCLNYVFVYGFRQVLIRSAGRFYFVGVVLFCENLQTHLGAILLGRALLIGTLWYFDSNFTEVCYLGSSWQNFIFGSGNGLVPNRQQAIIWTNADPVHWCIYSAPGGYELTESRAWMGK